MRRLLSSLVTLAAAVSLASTLAFAAVPEDAPRLSPARRAELASEDSTLRPDATPPPPAPANPRAALAAAGATTALAPLSTVPVNVPQSVLDAGIKGAVRVRVRVSTTGLVDSVIAVSGDPRLRACAIAAARWAIYAPPAKPTWTPLAIDVDGTQPSAPLVPDVVAMARDAEKARAWKDAVEWWTGALNRIGRHPSLTDEWTVREHVIQLARRLTVTSGVPSSLLERAQYARGGQFRTLARRDHEDYVRRIDEALMVVPWWPDGLQWRAASLLNCGRGIDAMRTLVLFRAAASNAAERSLANRAIAQLATGDTLGTASLLKREGAQYNRDEDADH